MCLQVLAFWLPASSNIFSLAILLAPTKYKPKEALYTGQTYALHITPLEYKYLYNVIL